MIGMQPLPLSNDTREPRVTERRGTASELVSTGPLSGQRLGRLSFGTRIARFHDGSAYYVGFDELFAREVTIEVLPAGLDDVVLPPLTHPRIADVVPFGVFGDLRLGVTDRIRGVSLAEFTDRADFGVEEVLGIGLDLLDALEHAHDNGVLHGGLEPAAVFIDPERRVRVLRFGREPSSQMYRDFEQRQNGPSIRGDVYAINAILSGVLGTSRSEPGTMRDRFAEVLQGCRDSRCKSAVTMRRALMAVAGLGEAPGRAHLAAMPPMLLDDEAPGLRPAELVHPAVVLSEEPRSRDEVWRVLERALLEVGLESAVLLSAGSLLTLCHASGSMRLLGAPGAVFATDEHRLLHSALFQAMWVGHATALVNLSSRVAAAVAAPIVSADQRVVGVLVVSAERLTAGDTESVTVLAAQVGRALDAAERRARDAAAQLALAQRLHELEAAERQRQDEAAAVTRLEHERKLAERAAEERRAEERRVEFERAQAERATRAQHAAPARAIVREREQRPAPVPARPAIVQPPMDTVAVPGHRGLHIMKRLVTNREYYAFVEATDAHPPISWEGLTPKPHLMDHPVTEIAYFEAQAYAAWLGCRLPTSEEWEAAAEGADPTIGNTRENKGRETTKVGAFPEGASACGALDMIGNVWEWTDSGQDDDVPADRVWVYGGSYQHWCTRRTPPRTAIDPGNQYHYLGFRCVWRSLAAV